MKRGKWDPRTKAMIVVEGLKGKPVADICIEHQISQAIVFGLLPSVRL